MNISQTIAQNIKLLCAENNITVNKLLLSCGINTSFITDLNKGKIPSADKVLKLAQYFQVSTDYLLTGKEHKLTLLQNDIVNDVNNDKGNEKMDFEGALYNEIINSFSKRADSIGRNEISRNLKLHKYTFNEFKAYVKSHFPMTEADFCDSINVCISNFQIKSNRNDSPEENSYAREQEQELLNILYKFDSEKTRDRFIGAASVIAREMLAEEILKESEM